MKKSILAVFVLLSATLLVMSACTKTETVNPCNGQGVLNVENKLDSTISVKITQTHDTRSIDKNFTLPFTLAGNQPYTLTIDGPQYHKDTTFMVLFCDNLLFIVTK
ncbi:MAG: hypothetical protein NTW16_14225 [Bacteroidetes bacterium]|nr:hypothetical protein [Bacteroidota bacterium]